ncbi:MAG TPA: hypothetical protein VKR31_03205 [Rhizomicrobium sp.]|nr:hypothetical protein [Rhizomicrobium sp.]
MRRLFAVIRSHGPAWDESRPLEKQADWPAHVIFMNALAAEGFVVVGGPLDGTEDTLLIISAEHEDEIRRRLASDPWSRGMLRLGRIAPWSLRLGEHRLAGGDRN